MITDLVDCCRVVNALAGSSNSDAVDPPSRQVSESNLVMFAADDGGDGGYQDESFH